MWVGGQFYTPAALSPVSKTSLYISIWGWLGPKLDVDVSEKSKISSSYGESKPDFSSVQNVA